MHAHNQWGRRWGEVRLQNALNIVQTIACSFKKLPPTENSSPPMVAQAGYGPVCDPTELRHLI